MSFKIISVELSNFSIHKHIFFEPSLHGITALRGKSGVGKSTIVDAILWAIYGTRIRNNKNSDLFNDKADWKKDKCYVKLKIIIDGEPYLVEKKLLTKTKTEGYLHKLYSNDKNELEIKPDETPLVNGSVNDLKNVLKKKLKMDEAGFLTSVFIQQNELNSILDSTGKAEKSVIEELIGISALSEASIDAQKSLRLLKSSLKTFDISEDYLKDKENDLKDLQNNIKKDTLQIEEIKSILTVEQKNIQDLKRDYQEKNSAFINSESLRSEKANLEAKIQSNDELILEVNTNKNAKKKKLDSYGSIISVDETEAKLKKVKKDFSNIEISLYKINNNIDEYENNIKNADNALLRIPDLNADNIVSRIEKGTLIIAKLNTQKDNLMQNIFANNSTLVQYKETVSALKSGNGQCPTCLQDVHDINVFEQRIIELEEKVSHHSKLLKNIQSKIDDSVQLLNNLEEIKVLVDKAKIAKDSIGDEKLKHSKLSIEYNKVNSELLAIDKSYSNAKLLSSIQSDYNDLVKKGKELIAKGKEYNLSLKRVNEELADAFSLSAKDLEKLRSIIEDRMSHFNNLKVDYSTVTGILNVNKEKEVYLKETIKNLRRELFDYKNTLKSLEIATATSKIVDEFKEDKVNSSINLIESYSSDLVHRFTNGFFTKITMSSDFKPSIYFVDGTVKTVNMLSGGQKAVLALAIRLSISLVLNGNSSDSVMILDEPVASQDPERAELIINSIKEVFKGQIILIAHNEFIDGIVDKRFELSLSNDNFSLMKTM